MTDNCLNLFCLFDGEATSNAFSVEIDPTKTVDGLKKLIRAEKSPEFDDVAADKLILWRVSIQDDDNDDDDLPILLDSVPEKKKLKPTTKLSKIFGTKLPEDTIHIVVQRSSLPPIDALYPEVAALRQQLSQLEKFHADVQDSNFSFGIVVKPEKKISFSWIGVVETATLGKLKGRIFEYYPQYAHDDYLEVFFYNGQPKPACIRSDEDLRDIINFAKATSKARLTISLETPSKNFSAWTFRDVCDEYDLSKSSDPGVEELPPFTDIQSTPLDSDLQKETLDLLIREIESKKGVLPLFSANEATKSMVVGSFLVAATTLFKDDLYLVSQRNLSGRRGNGPVDFSVHSRKTYAYTLGVTEVKRDDFKQGVAQNIVQLESALTEKKRKREAYDVDGEEESPRKQRAYGIVTDSETWLFLECTLHEDETVTYRMSKLKEKLNYEDRWQEDAKSASLAILTGSLILLLTQKAEAHSYVDCVDWRFNDPKNRSWSDKNGACFGYTRRFPLKAKPFAKLDSDKESGEEPGADETMGKPISAAYNGKDERGRKTGIQTVSKPGGELCIRWPAKNHAVPNEKNQPVTIALSEVNPKKDPTQLQFLDNIIAKLNYKNCTDKGKDEDIWPCGGCFKLPTNLQPGNFVMQWRWKLNSNEWYTSCADIDVKALNPTVGNP
ncbi:hypothetical protein BGX29_011353 [Mortierella sp. GBA35]|nr:hypothetical protein BGX29_011353 [Mortierella sp. GBA35]